MLIKGISSQINEKRDIELILKWLEFLDYLYFTSDEHIIELNKEDKEILLENPDCRDKLMIISFKPNIIIKNLEF